MRGIVALLTILAVPFSVASAQEPRSPSAPMVAVDAGHGTRVPGAVGARGTREHDLNVAIASRLVAALRVSGLGATVLDPDGSLENGDRAALAGRLGAAALVSIHHDSVQPRYLRTWTVDHVRRQYSDRARGFSVFFSGAGKRPEESLSLARAVGEELLGIRLTPSLHHAEPIPGEGRELVDAIRGVYRYDELAVLRHASMPAVLVECGVIVDRDEEAAALSPRRQDAVAAAVARAVARFLRNAESRVAPRTATPLKSD